MNILSLSTPRDGFKIYVLLFVIGVSLALGLVFILTLDQDSDAVDIDKIGRDFCKNPNLDPTDLERLKTHLLNTEQIDFQDINEMQDYLCGTCKDCFFPNDEKSFLKWFGVSKKIFHDNVKKRILKTLLSSSERIRKFLKKTNNPDIGINQKTGRVVLKNTRNAQETLETNLFIKNFLPWFTLKSLVF